MAFKPAKYLGRITDFKVLSRLFGKLRFDDNTDCWVWNGCRHHENGYGKIKVEGKTLQAHRVAYAIFNGEIPVGMTVEHLCGNPTCCNPRHMTLLTHSENCKKKYADRLDKQ